MAANKAATFVGIHNEREFYSDHYIAEILMKDLRQTVKRWRAESDAAENRPPTPEHQLRVLSAPYRGFRSRFESRRGTVGDRIGVQEQWHPAHAP